jgi:hypothetical protein
MRGEAHRESTRAISALAKHARRLIGLGAWILPFWFAWLQFKNVPIVATLQTVQPYVIMQILLIVYYSCWVFGTKFDVTTQESIYLTQYEFPWKQFGSGVVLIVVAGVLLWASTDDKKFAAALSVFLALNIIFWVTLTHSVGKIIDDTRKKYAEDRDLYGLAQLEIVEEYILGHWQWHRFIGMAVIVIVGDLICFAGSIRQSISVSLQPISYGMTATEISALLPQLGFLAFISFAESWIWYKRAVTRAAMYALNRLALKYKLEPL